MKECPASILGIRLCNNEPGKRCIALLNDQINDGLVDGLDATHFSGMQQWAKDAFVSESLNDTFWPDCVQRKSVMAAIISVLTKRK